MVVPPKDWVLTCFERAVYRQTPSAIGFWPTFAQVSWAVAGYPGLWSPLARLRCEALVAGR